MEEIKKEKLINDVYKWLAMESEVTTEKEKLLRMMIEATLDYLYERGYLNVKKGEKNNGREK